MLLPPDSTQDELLEIGLKDRPDVMYNTVQVPSRRTSCSSHFQWTVHLLAPLIAIFPGERAHGTATESIPYMQ